ncbi:MAG: hypothetical protein ACO1SV_08100 [Fimbriimonas sp.]
MLSRVLEERNVLIELGELLDGTRTCLVSEDEGLTSQCDQLRDEVTKNKRIRSAYIFLATLQERKANESTRATSHQFDEDTLEKMRVRYTAEFGGIEAISSALQSPEYSLSGLNRRIRIFRSEVLSLNPITKISRVDARAQSVKVRFRGSEGRSDDP